MDDAARLMARYCGGDAQAFRELYALVAPVVLERLRRDVHEPAVAAAMLDRTFIAVHRSRAAYIAGTSPIMWIYAIADRLVNRYRS